MRSNYKNGLYARLMRIRRGGCACLCIYFLLLAISFLPATTAWSQNTKSTLIKVSGQVKNEKGEVMPDVSITVKDTKIAGTTSADGKFSITVADKNAVLVFNYVGYDPVEKKIGDNKPLEVLMSPGNGNLNDVIVIGYGTQKKRDVTGSITSISAKQIEERQATSIADALQGFAAGMLVTNDAGKPGANGTITIRGNSTFEGGNSPLFVVDGMLRDNADDINPNDIQSVEVLKDGASAAIYGSRSANGVIIITTKRGQEAKPKIDLRYLRNYGRIANKVRQANADEVRAYRQIQSGGAGLSGMNADSLNPTYNSDINYIDELTQTAIKDQADVSLSGGAKGFSYYSSLRFVNDVGLIINSWAKQVQGRLNLDWQASKRFKFTNQIAFGWRNMNEISEGQSIAQGYQRDPRYRLYTSDGNLIPNLGGRRNPVAEALLFTNESLGYNANVFNQMLVDINKNLKFTMNFNVDFSQSTMVRFHPMLLSTTNDNNDGSEAWSRGFGWQFQNFLNFNKTFGTRHNVTALLGISSEKKKSNSISVSGTNFASEDVLTMNSAGQVVIAGANGNPGTTSGGSANSLASAFARFGYSYDGKYVLNATYRTDGSSRFGSDKRWGSFVSTGVSWRFSDESFMRWAAKYVQDGKLRLSVGRNGNERIGDFSARSKYVFGSTFYFGVNGIQQDNIFGNSTLGWEKTTQTNIGMDLALFNRRVNVVIDYYIKSTTDLLYAQEMPKESGFSQVYVNVGDIENRGMEFTVNANLIRKKDFDWSINSNISFERGKINRLANGQFIRGNIDGTGGASYLIREGGAIGDFYGWKTGGIFQYNESNAFTADWVQLTPIMSSNGIFGGYLLNGKPYNGPVQSMYYAGYKLGGGDRWFQKFNFSDSTSDDRDRVVIGNARPKYYYALTNDVRYKRFQLSFTLNASVGGKIYNAVAQSMNVYSSSNGIALPNLIYGAWRKAGDISDFPTGKNFSSTGGGRTGDYVIEDGSFLRLAYARLTFNLDPRFAKRIFAQRVNAYIYANNIITWTNYSWFDPEFSSGTLTPGVDNGRYPRRREMGLGVNVTF